MAAVLQPWVEKHRPKVIEDVAHQDEVVSTLSKAMKTANMPHLLFYGPPGTGKTTTALAVGRYLYGPKLFSERVLELNASDERGISVVRNKIKMFASCVVGHGDPDHPSPPYKLLILDEADSMTSEAQDALRRIMETHSATTRFCFICNYVSRIIEPLASRCAKFRFKPLLEHVMETRVKQICAIEGVELASDTLETLARVSRGDLRRAITTLQSAYALKGNPVASETLLDVSGEVPVELTDQLIAACKDKSFANAEKCITEVIAEGYSITAVMEQLFTTVIDTKEMSDAQKAKAVDAMATADKKLVDGADGVLQLLSVASILQQLYNGMQCA